MPESVLTVDMLERFRGHAGKYDRENSFFYEDFEELRELGYLKLCLPEEFGGRTRRWLRSRRSSGSWLPTRRR